MNRFKKYFVVIFAFVLTLSMFPSVHAVAQVKEVNIDLVGTDLNQTGSIELNYDESTNILVDKEGTDLTFVDTDKQLYELKSVDITRKRQKVEIEYHLGDYNSSTLIGTDSGYADVDDFYSSYYLSIDNINEKFGTTIPTIYRIVVLEGPARSWIEEVVEPETPVKIKLLVAEVLSYSLSARVYMNRQDVLNPVANGKLQTDIEANTEFWRVHRLSTSFKGIKGQVIDLKKSSQIKDTYTAGSRTGTLAEFGYFDKNGVFVLADTITIGDDLPSPMTSAAFYQVDDYGTPAVKPGESSGLTSGANVGIVGGNKGWKNPTSTESYDVATQSDILSAYAFNLDGDPFINPEHTLNYPDANWMLKHPLSIKYNYDIKAFYYNVTFNSNGGSEVLPQLKIMEGNLVTEPAKPTKDNDTFLGWFRDQELTTPWDFDTDTMSADLVLYAGWETPIPTYTVTYTDGTANQSIFNDEIHSDLIAGDTTPLFSGSLVRDGYKFMGWSPVASETVTGTVVYVAQWEEIEPATSYVVTYTDGTGNQSIFKDEINSGLFLGDATPEFKGNLTREGYKFMGWSPVASETVTGTVVYVAQWGVLASLPGTGLESNYAGYMVIAIGALMLALNIIDKKLKRN